MGKEHIDIQSFREVFNERFSLFWKKVLEENAYMPIAYTLLLQCQKVSTDGKRLRPYIAYIGYSISHNEHDVDNHRYNIDVIDTLIGLELFHLFALVHDDSIDRASTRHNVPTVHFFAEQFQTERDMPVDEKAHLGQSYAILAGDLLFSFAQKVLLANQGNKRVNELFSQMSEQVIAGQMLDVEMSTQTHTALESICLKNVMKTAHYTFVYPFKIGAAIRSDEHVKEQVDDTYDSFFESIGTDLGIAFQMYDDITDLVADVRSFQHTNLTNYIFGNNRVLGDFSYVNIHELEEEQILNIFKDTGAIDHSLSVCDEKIRNAKDQIDRSFLTASLKTILIEVVNNIRPPA